MSVRSIRDPPVALTDTRQDCQQRPGPANGHRGPVRPGVRSDDPGELARASDQRLCRSALRALVDGIRPGRPRDGLALLQHQSQSRRKPHRHHTRLPASGASYYDWQVPASLVGGTYFIFARIDDASVYSISLAPGTFTVDPANTDRITSAPVVDEPN